MVCISFVDNEVSKITKPPVVKSLNCLDTLYGAKSMQQQQPRNYGGLDGSRQQFNKGLF